MTFTTRPELVGKLGMASSTHWLASQVSMGILERGGNAFDAAVTGGFVLQVVEPHQNGPGGDMTLLFADHETKRPTVLCAQGPAPAGASRETFESLGLDMVPGTGLLAAAVPGATLGWMTLLRDHGTMTLGEVLTPAIEYARDGYPAAPKVVEFISRMEGMFREYWWPSADVYLPNGILPEAGDLLFNRAMSRTFDKLVEREVAVLRSGGSRVEAIEAAMDEWSDGFVAESISQFCKSAWRDSSGKEHAGLLRERDLEAWRPHYEEPETTSFGGYLVCKPGFWTQGPALLQQLAILDGMEAMPTTVQGIHNIIEATKLAFADRDAWYGDTPEVPREALLSLNYATERRRLIGDEASMTIRPGKPNGANPNLPNLKSAQEFDTTGLTGVGEPNAVKALLDSGPNAEGECRTDTVHIDVVDQWGNMVAAMPSGGWLHSSPVIPDLGFPLGTRLQMAWLDAESPNSLEPGKRPRTTLSPTLVCRGGEPVIAFGSPGGDQQDQWQLHFLLNHLAGGMNIQEAIDAPSFHTTHSPSSFFPHEHQPGVVLIEGRARQEVVQGLRERGHRVGVSDDWEIGRMCAVSRDPNTGILRGGANPRGMQGYAVGR